MGEENYYADKCDDKRCSCGGGYWHVYHINSGRENPSGRFMYGDLYEKEAKERAADLNRYHALWK